MGAQFEAAAVGAVVVGVFGALGDGAKESVGGPRLSDGDDVGNVGEGGTGSCQ
jgi:hypothetical protein